MEVAEQPSWHGAGRPVSNHFYAKMDPDEDDFDKELATFIQDKEHDKSANDQHQSPLSDDGDSSHINNAHPKLDDNIGPKGDADHAQTLTDNIDNSEQNTITALSSHDNSGVNNESSKVDGDDVGSAEDINEKVKDELSSKNNQSADSDHHSDVGDKNDNEKTPTSFKGFYSAKNSIDADRNDKDNVQNENNSVTSADLVSSLKISDDDDDDDDVLANNNKDGEVKPYANSYHVHTNNVNAENDEVDNRSDVYDQRDNNQSKVASDTIQTNSSHDNYLEKYLELVTSADNRTSDQSPEEESAQAGPGDQSQDAVDNQLSDGNQSDEEHDYQISEDQLRAIAELEQLKAELDYSEEPPPEYDVKERVRQLNEEFANDPVPIDDDREITVSFKEKLVDLEVPPSDTDDDENDDTPRNGTGSDNTDSVTNKTATSHKSKKVLVERDGTFELVSADDVTAEELMFLDQSSSSENETKADGVHDAANQNEADQEDVDNSRYATDNDDHVFDSRVKENTDIGDAIVQDHYSAYEHAPRPPSHPRPMTANGSSSRPRPRPLSSQTHSGTGSTWTTQRSSSVLDNFTYNSPYALTSKEKERGRRMDTERERHERDEARKKIEDHEKQQQENEEAFEAWLLQKRRDRAMQRQDEQERKRRERKQPMSDQDYFSDWLTAKRKEQRKNKLLKQREELEEQQQLTIHSRVQCDSSFREWLKNKNRESRQNRIEDRRRTRIYFQSRRSRKSQAIMRAVKNAQGFHYVDYYGYRF